MKTGYAALIGFVLSIPLANWLIHNIGTVCIPDGPCLIPVAPGLMSPSGVLVIGAALVLRDVVHEKLGWRYALTGIFIGGILSGLVASPAFIAASIVAFTFSELADMAVYTPLRKNKLWLAVLLSGLAGSIMDSVLFLSIAFGSLDHVIGNTVGKFWMSLLAVLVLLYIRRRNAKHSFI
jgi:queuosine precursor transporter